MFSSKKSFQVNPCHGVVSTSCQLYKLYTDFKQKVERKQDTAQEIDSLMNLCLDENESVSLLACHLLVRVIEDGCLPMAQGRTMLLSMLPTAEGVRFRIVVEAVCTLVMVELKEDSKGGKYNCPYGLQHPEHPFITVLNAKNATGHEIAAWMKEIINHQNKNIVKASWEFLRPLFLYIVREMERIPNVRTLWNLMISCGSKSEQGNFLFMDCLKWINCQSPSVMTIVLLNDTVEAMLGRKKHTNTVAAVVLLASSLVNSLKLGVNPRESLTLINRALKSECSEVIPHSLLLIICIDLLRIISPIYLDDLLSIIKHLVFVIQVPGQMIHYILLDVLILWSTEGSFITKSAQKEIEKVREYVEGKMMKVGRSEIPEIDFYDVNVEGYLNICRYCDLVEENIEESWERLRQIYSCTGTSKQQLIRKIISGSVLFFQQTHRGNFTRILTQWKVILQNLPTSDESSEVFAAESLVILKYLLRKCENPEERISILRVISVCGRFWSNMKTILAIIEDFSRSNPTLRSDLLTIYVDLWLIEARTYRYLFDQLSAARGKADKQLNMTRVEAIRTICRKNPTQYGPDLVAHLSDALNQCSSPSDDGEVICTVLDTIILLCDSKTVSIVAIWRALGFIFRYEKRPNVLKSLCHFFSQLPAHHTSSPDYTAMSNEVYERLWSYAISSKDLTVQESAFKALAKFPLDRITFTQIPNLLKQEVKVKSKPGLEVDVTYIPGECWQHLLEKINRDALPFAGDFLRELVYREIQEYRGGVYRVPEGKGEPDNLSHLPPKSIVRHIAQLIQREAQISTHTSTKDHILIESVRILSHDFPKPLPPVNWSCLHEIFHRSLEIRTHCVSLAVNQSIISGTAKRFLQNYLEGFEPCGEDSAKEILLVFSKLPALLERIDVHLVRKCIKQCLQFSSSHHQTGILLSILDRIAEASSSLQESHVHLIGELLEETGVLAKPDEKVRKALCFCLCQFPDNYLQYWMDLVSIYTPKLEEDMRFNLASAKRDLVWIDPLIEKMMDLSINFKQRLTVTLVSMVQHSGSFENIFKWCLNTLSQIQSQDLCHHHPDESSNKVINRCTVFTLVVVVSSGWLYIEDTVPGNFAASLVSLSRELHWRDQYGQIYQFLFDLLQTANFPGAFAKVFKKAIVCSKDLSHFSNKVTWTKYMSLRDF
ncbi:hypothetical protein DMENIID0001_111670 [Sergentomyia squamirostris]